MSLFCALSAVTSSTFECHCRDKNKRAKIFNSHCSNKWATICQGEKFKQSIVGEEKPQVANAAQNSHFHEQLSPLDDSLCCSSFPLLVFSAWLEPLKKRRRLASEEMVNNAKHSQKLPPYCAFCSSDSLRQILAYEKQRFDAY